MPHLRQEKTNTKKQLKINLVPFSSKLGDIQYNIKKIQDIIKIDIQEKESDVIIFPELALTGYLLENLVADVALSSNHPILDEVKKLSKTTDIYLGLILKEKNQFFNAVIYFSQTKIKSIQKKIYPPTYGMFDELRYVTRASEQNVFESKLGKTGILICEDAWHPLLAYNLYMANAKHIIVVSASPNRGFDETDEFTSVKNWKKRLEVYAESFGIFFYYVNRSGIEDGLLYGGHHYIISPTGKICENTDNTKSHYQINLEELDLAIQKGGPYQEENWQVNQKLFEDSYLRRNQN